MSVRRNNFVRATPGAQPKNRNALKHGLRGAKLPEGCLWVELRSNKLRRNLEDALLSVKGEVTLSDAATLRAIWDCEAHRLKAARWLRLKDKELTISEQLKLSEAMVKASAEIAKLIRSLSLDRDASDTIINQLYTHPKRLPHDNEIEGNGHADGAGGTDDK